MSGQESFILFTHFIIFIAYLQRHFDTLSHIILMLVQYFYHNIKTKYTFAWKLDAIELGKQALKCHFCITIPQKMPPKLLLKICRSQLVNFHLKRSTHFFLKHYNIKYLEFFVLIHVFRWHQLRFFHSSLYYSIYLDRRQFLLFFVYLALSLRVLKMERKKNTSFTKFARFAKI